MITKEEVQFLCRELSREISIGHEDHEVVFTHEEWPSKDFSNLIEIVLRIRFDGVIVYQDIYSIPGNYTDEAKKKAVEHVYWKLLYSVFGYGVRYMDITKKEIMARQKKNHIPLNGKDDEFIRMFNEMADILAEGTRPVTMDDLWAQLSPTVQKSLNEAARRYIKGKEIK